mmetsp:Transcript_44934/g.121048  ORF Transcript_44934/g.121048 Transcript_44934/m.121048 type:complete len:201 (+) Transcript_44934:1137-1739(+)
MPELRNFARPRLEVVEGDDAVHVRVDPGEDLEEVQLLLPLLVLHLHAAALDVLLSELRGRVHDHGGDQIEHAEYQGQQGAHEDDGRPGLVLDDRDGHPPPAVPRDDCLEECDIRLGDGGKGPSAPLAVRPLAVAVRELNDEGMNQLHGDGPPDAHGEAHHQHGPEERPEATAHHVHQLCKLREALHPLHGAVGPEQVARA